MCARALALVGACPLHGLCAADGADDYARPLVRVRCQNPKRAVHVSVCACVRCMCARCCGGGLRSTLALSLMIANRRDAAFWAEECVTGLLCAHAHAHAYAYAWQRARRCVQEVASPRSFSAFSVSRVVRRAIVCAAVWAGALSGLRSGLELDLARLLSLVGVLFVCVRGCPVISA